MIQVISGIKGSGKTKRLIDLANEALKSEHGYIVFVDDDKRYMYDLRHEVRFVDASEYGVDNVERLYGLFAGMLAVNFDITLICVDGFMKLTGAKPEDLEWLFANLDKLSEAHHVNFVLSVSGDAATLPEFITKYAI